MALSSGAFYLCPRQAGKLACAARCYHKRQPTREKAAELWLSLGRWDDAALSLAYCRPQDGDIFQLPLWLLLCLRAMLKATCLCVCVCVVCMRLVNRYEVKSCMCIYACICPCRCQCTCLQRTRVRRHIGTSAPCLSIPRAASGQHPTTCPGP